MNLSRDIIRDLLPAYWSGEASEATRQAVEDYFRSDPAFADEVTRVGTAVSDLEGVVVSKTDPAAELAALRGAKRVLRRQRILLALASTFTLNALTLGFSFEIVPGHVRVHWMSFPGQRTAVLAAVIIAAGLWAIYFRVDHRVRNYILG